MHEHELEVEVIVDEGYDSVERKSFLHIECFDKLGMFKSGMIAMRNASPEYISEVFSEIAYYLEDDPQMEEERSDLHFLIDFFRAAAKNVPGLDKHY